MFTSSSADSPIMIIPVRPAADPGEDLAASSPAGLPRRAHGQGNSSRRTFGFRLPSRRTFGHRFPSRRTFGI